MMSNRGPSGGLFFCLAAGAGRVQTYIDVSTSLKCAHIILIHTHFTYQRTHPSRANLTTLGKTL